MGAFNDAWVFLKNEENEEDQPTTSLAEVERILSQQQTGMDSEEPHSKEEILDLMVQHGALVGRMPHELGSPEWSENMDELESTGVFDSLDHHYAKDAFNAANDGSRTDVLGTD